ncbi:MAG: hypothetical protein K2J39_13165, partial [Ruminococcus sp.]|nr:hypothetical protein [Ruminococcus sp.]
MYGTSYIKRWLLTVVMALQSYSATVTESETPTEISTEISSLAVSTISVSCLKVTWECEENMQYSVTCNALDDNYEYADNIYFEFKSNGLCSITGLRENNEYSVIVEGTSIDGKTKS